MFTYNIITEDRNGKEYNDEVISTIQFLFNTGDYFRDTGLFPERWLREFTVKVDKVEKTED